MSYLNGPRINFWGGGSTNVDTANNLSHGITDPVSAMVTASGTDDQLIAALRRTPSSSSYPPLGSWNYYGDHQVAFRGTKVSSAGAPGAVATTDSLAGLPVYLLGSVDPQTGEGPYGGPVMVDLDPTSGQTTQIYVGGLQIGGSAAPALLVRADTRCHSHMLGLRYDSSKTSPPYLPANSVFANGTFQVAFPREAVVHADRSHPTLAAILDAPGAIGIVVRFCMFEFYCGMSPEEQQQNFAQNRNDANPSLGRIIGTLGPWLADEPATCPVGRLLQNTTLGGAQGVAWLDTDAPRLTLDLSSALEGQAIRSDPTGITGPIGPNVDYGDIQVAAGTTVVASTPSLPDDYYVYGGVYDVKLDDAAAKALAQNPITLTGTAAKLQVVEVPTRIFSDDRNVYLDDVGGTATLSLRVQHLGGPVPKDVPLDLAAGASGELPVGTFLSFPSSVTVPAGADRVSVQVTDNGGPAGFVALNVTAPGKSTYFVNFRKYPHDDFSAQVAAGPLEWDFVYEQCLRYFYVIFPAMSKRIPLNDQATIVATGGEILKRLSPAYHGTTLRMPITRSLSPGKEALLRTYLQQQGAGGG